MAQAPPLRDLTVVVRVLPPPVIRSSYEALGTRHRQLRPLLELHAEGGFGSGFVVVHSEGKETKSTLFVVTNQHVVGLAETAAIEFDGKPESWDARVVYVDGRYDLAVLVLDWETTAGAPPVSEGFGLAEAPPRDQDAVVATGYPGIAGRPSYQVTRGHVSNERLMLPIDASSELHIQHTAPIDPGSSGGPLLDETGRVLGINTLKIQGREGVGLSVPADAIRHALERARASLSSSWDEEADLQLGACETLVRHLRGGELQAVERGLSSSLTAKQGPLSLGLLPDDGTDWAEAFVHDPEAILLHALALRVQATLWGQGEAEGRTGPACSTSDGAVSLSLGGAAPRQLRFVREQGQMKLLDADLISGTRTSFLDPPPKRSKKWSPSLR